MNQNQQDILIALCKFHQEQEQNDPNGEYFDPQNGGIFSNDLANFVKLSWQDIELEAMGLSALGYVNILIRKDDVEQHGLQATPEAVIWYKTYLAGVEAQADIDEATAEAEYLAVEAEKAQIKVTLVTAYADWDKADKDAVLKGLTRLKLLEWKS